MKEIASILVSPTDDFRQVLKIIDNSAVGFALVVGPENKLLGTVTDGDLRRAMIQGPLVDKTAEDLMNKSPRTIDAGVTHSDQQKFLMRNKITFAPIVDQTGSVVSVAVSPHLPGSTLDNVAVVVMAGGLG